MSTLRFFSIRTRLEKAPNEAVKLVGRKQSGIRSMLKSASPEIPRVLFGMPIDDCWLKSDAPGFASGKRIFAGMPPLTSGLLKKWFEFVRVRSEEFQSCCSPKLKLADRGTDVFCRGRTHASFEQWFTRDDLPAIAMTMTKGYWSVTIHPSSLRYPNSERINKCSVLPPAHILNEMESWSEEGLEVVSADGSSKRTQLSGAEALRQLELGWRLINARSTTISDHFVESLNEYVNVTGDIRADVSMDIAKVDRWLCPILNEQWGKDYSVWIHSQPYRSDLRFDEVTTEEWTRFPLATNDTRNGLDIQVDLLVKGNERYYDVQGTDEAKVLAIAEAIGSKPERFEGDDLRNRWVQ